MASENTSLTKSETIKMVENAMTVLDLLRLSKESLGVNEIAKKCSITPSTAFRILKTLEITGWAFQCSDDRYIIGEKVSFRLEKDNMFLTLKEIARFTMVKYTEKYGRAMNLVVRDGMDCYIIQQSRTRNIVDYIPPLHSWMPFYACAGGKILLSEQPILLVEKILEATELTPFTQYTITDREEFWKELRQVSKQGYAFDHMESSEDGSCISVPVRDKDGNIVAALSFSGFIAVDDPENLLEYLPALKEASAEISRNIYEIWKK